MEQRDRELLDKQVWGLRRPRNNRVTVLTVIAVFFAGMTLGGILFAHESKPMRIASNQVAGGRRANPDDSRLALFEIAIEMFGWRLGNGSCVVL